MFIFFGTYTQKIKYFHNSMIACNKCGNIGLDCFVYQECFHLFWIPVFPSSRKMVLCQCYNCSEEYVAKENQMQQDLAKIKTPFYMFSIPIIFIVALIFSIIIGINDNIKKTTFIENPKLNDVYVIKDTTANTKYYFLKIKEISAEDVLLYHSALEYKKFVRRMSIADYFVINDSFKLSKHDLIHYFKKGFIKDILRNYPNSTGFFDEDTNK